MIKAIVVDDEVFIAEHICRLLKNAEVEVLKYCTNPYEAFEKVSILKPDVLFLDIEMPEISGLELAERLHAAGYEGEIVFITAYNQYAIEAFSVNALDYLLKPIRPEELNRAIERVKKRRAAALSSVVKKVNKKIRISLFGSMFIYVGEDKTALRWMTAKSAEIFAFMLLLKGEKEVSKWRLMDEIWPDKNKEKGDINLRSTISRLNKTLRENSIDISIVSTGNGYKLNVEEADIEVDAFILEKLVLRSPKVNAENAENYESIILGYRGMLLDEFSGEWCSALRSTYNRYFISGAKKLIKYYESIDEEPIKILNIIELMIRYDPYDEEIRNSALRLHYRLGGKKGAEKYYKEYWNLVKKDLEIEPSEAMENLYKSILNR